MPAVTSDTRLVRAPDLVTSDMDGDIVMMNIDQGKYFGIGGVGPRLWELLEQPRTPDELVRLICAEYEVDESTCRADIIAFVQNMLDAAVARRC
jgi:hypothetical protein